MDGVADGFQMHEFGIGGEIEKFERLRQQQQRGRRLQDRVRHRDDGTYRTIVRRLLVRIVTGRRGLLCPFPAAASLPVSAMSLCVAPA